MGAPGHPHLAGGPYLALSNYCLVPHIWPSFGQMWEAGSAPRRRFERIVSFTQGGYCGEPCGARATVGEFPGDVGTHICQQRQIWGTLKGKGCEMGTGVP